MKKRPTRNKKMFKHREDVEMKRLIGPSPAKRPAKQRRVLKGRI